MKRHRVAVLGTGSAGQRHLRALRACGFPAIAVPARSGRRKALAEESFAVARDLSEAARLGASACVVATDTRRHAADAIAALALGLHVLVEKPLAANAREAYVLRRAAARARRRVFVAAPLRFARSLDAFRGRLPSLGQVHAARVECRSFLPDWRPGRPYRRSYSARADEGGVLRDLIHDVDYAGWIFGWPAAVSGRLRNLRRLGIASEETADLEWESGDCRVSVGLDYLTRPPRRRMTAFGSRGTLEWDALAGGETLDALFARQDRAFVRALGGAADFRLATLEDGLRALAVCDAARRSSRSRRIEKVRPR